MGQIIGSAAKPKRCNANQLSQVPTPAAGEHILVSSDNSMNAAGQGNFDCYIVGDGQTAATALELKNDAFLESHKPYTKAYTFDDGVSLTGLNYKTNDAVVGAKFTDITAAKMGNSLGCKIPVMAGDVVTFKGKPYTYSVLLTDKDGIVLVKQANDGTITNGTQWNIEQDGYIYWNPNFQPFVVIDGIMKVGSLYNIDKRLEVLEEDTHVDEFIEDINSASHREINIDIPSLQVYRTNIWGGNWVDVNNTARKSIIVPTKKNFIYRLSVPAETTVYYCLVTDISNAMTINSPVAFDPEYKDKVAATPESTIEIAGKEGEYLWVREDTALNFSLTEIGSDYEYIWRSEIVDNLDSESSTKVLSAKQGKILNDKFSSKVDHVVDFSSAGKDWGTRYTEGTEYTLSVDENNPRLIVYTKIKSMPGALLTLLITGLVNGETYHWHMEYTSTSNVTNSGSIYKQSSRDKTSGISLNMDESKLHGSGTYTMDFDFVYDASNCFYGWYNNDAFSNNSTLTITAFSITQTKDIHDIYEMVAGGDNDSTSYANVVSLFADKKTLADSLKHGSTNFSCLLFSDLHGDSVNLSRIMDLYDNWEDYFTCGINVGDTIYDTIDTGTAWYWTTVGDREFLFALGNHDVWGTDGSYNTAVDQAEYDAWIVPLVNKTTGLVRPSNADSDLLPYYYKDYGNIRVIVLSTYTNRLSSDLAWFTNVLSDAINNSKKVIVVNHIAHSLASRGNTIQHNVASEGDYNNGFKSYLTSGSQQGYVDAPTGDTDNVGNGFVVAVKTFMDNGGTFITWITGHMHRDFFTDLSGTSHEAICGKQAFITLSTARADYQNDNPKTWPDGTGMDSFYMFSVDEELGVFKLMKFGAETDYAMRPRKFFAYSYVDHKIVAQS